MNESRLELVLKLSVAGLLVAVLGFGGYFGWTVYSDRLAAAEATPALRVIKAMREQVKKSPNDAVLRVRLGEALASAGKYQEAVEQLNAALKISPDHTGALLDLGQIAMINKKPEKAREYFLKVVELTGDSNLKEVNQRREVALYQLGILAMAKKDYPGAIGNFKAALRIRKDASDTYYYLALAFDQSGESDEAKDQLKLALAFDPNFGQARYLYGRLLLRDGDKVGAAEQFRYAVDVDSEAPEPKKELAALGDSKELAEQARKLLDTDADAAFDAVRIACYVDPQNLEALKLHADMLVDRGDKERALEVYTQAEQVDPADASIKAAIKELQPKKAKKKKG